MDPKNTQESTATEATEAKSPGLPLRDALEVGLAAARDTEEKEKAQARELISDEGEQAPASAASEETQERSAAAPGLKPPAEWSKDEKADFFASTPTQQAALLRVFNARQGSIEEIRRGREELKGMRAEFEAERQLASSMRPFIKAMGGKFPTEIALQKAVQMWHELENAEDPRAAAAAYLRAKKIPVPKELEGVETTPQADAKVLAPLQDKINSLESKLAQIENAPRVNQIMTEWDSFERETNAAGKPRFPDLDTSTEAGIHLASNIGSLVGGKSDLSRQFIASVKSRIPDCNYQRLLLEAYRYLGGRVDDSEAPRTTSNRQHIASSRRAASSVPGRGGNSSIAQGKVQKFKSRREALQHAIEVTKTE